MLRSGEKIVNIIVGCFVCSSSSQALERRLRSGSGSQALEHRLALHAVIGTCTDVYMYGSLSPSHTAMRNIGLDYHFKSALKGLTTTTTTILYIPYIPYILYMI